MVGLLKTTKPYVEHDKQRSGCDFLHLNTTDGLETNCVMSEACKLKSKRQFMAFAHDCSDKLEQQPKDVSFNSFSSINRSQDSTGGKPPKRRRIVSVTRHRFEPFVSKDNLVSRRFAQSFSASHNTVTNDNISKQNLCSDLSKNMNGAPAELQVDSDSVIYRLRDKCFDFEKEDHGDIVSTNVRSQISDHQVKSSGYYKTCPIQSPCHISLEQGKIKEKPMRQNFCQSETRDNSARGKSCQTTNVNVTERQTAPKEEGLRLVNVEEGGYEMQAVMSDESARYDMSHSSGSGCNGSKSKNRNIYSAHCDNWIERRELTTLKVFVANESVNSENLRPKQLFMPPSERLKCLKFSPGQYFDIAFEEIPMDELKRLISEVNGKENQAAVGFENGNTKENFVKDLRNLFGRLSTLEEELLKEGDIFEMILLAKAYFDKYKHEIKEKNKNNQVLENAYDQVPKSSSEMTSVKEETCLEMKSSASSEKKNEGTCYQFVGFQPITDNDQDDTLLVDDKEHATISDLDCENYSIDKISPTSSPTLQCICYKDETNEVQISNKLRNYACDKKLLEKHTIQCSDDILKNDRNRLKKQEVISKAGKRRRCSVRKRQSSSKEGRNKCDSSGSLSERDTPSLNVCASGEKEIASASTKTFSVTVDERKFNHGKHEVEKGSKVGCCRSDWNEYQSGRGKEEDGARKLLRPREISSQDKIVIASALLSLRECQPIPTDVGAILVSSHDAIVEFALIETVKFYRQLLTSFLQEKEESVKNVYKLRLQMFKNNEEKEFAERTENIMEEKKQDGDLRLDCEMQFTSQYFRQELWIRIQKCVCGRVGQLPCCGRCNSTFYCGKKCQVVDFEDHRVVCKHRKFNLDRFDVI